MVFKKLDVVVVQSCTAIFCVSQITNETQQSSVAVARRELRHAKVIESNPKKETDIHCQPDHTVRSLEGQNLHTMFVALRASIATDSCAAERCRSHKGRIGQRAPLSVTLAARYVTTKSALLAVKRLFALPIPRRDQGRI
jgi:hypothetical protein